VEVTVPAIGAKTPLTIALPKPMDVASLRGFLTVTDAKGKFVKGHIKVGVAERRGSFSRSSRGGRRNIR